jgi:hypothetical protein
MAPCLIGKFEITNEAGEKLLNQNFSPFSTVAARPIEDYANHKKLVGETFDSAATLLAIQISQAVDRKAP